MPRETPLVSKYENGNEVDVCLISTIDFIRYLTQLGSRRDVTLVDCNSNNLEDIARRMADSPKTELLSETIDIILAKSAYFLLDDLISINCTLTFFRLY